MQLSKRLYTVASLVTPKNRVADVGCDHAYTSIYLVEHKISPQVVAMDINQGPLERARENIKKKGYEDLIDIRRSNGLEKLKIGEVDTVLIAGMGGGLIVQILSEYLELVSSLKELILQPQSETHRVRKMVHDIGFLITQENMIKEDGKYYVMMKAQAKEFVREVENYQLIKEEHFHYGRFLLERKHPILEELLGVDRQLCENIYQTLLLESTENALNRQQELLLRIELINQGLRYYA